MAAPAPLPPIRAASAVMAISPIQSPNDETHLAEPEAEELAGPE